ncbi:DUF3846 domain-containing protein [Arthrobacter sp. ISL-72]|uniref:DUF3846 domain-containing protein n=1 Tax=Arthrobacter sp. ISL-72 TaxID=2819114 RepID=UPI001BEB4661|nr:DUF3846 domain-containing protein [Arthrobacter sp. ISL-72]MBT2598002.1 DUF3846 domain-containing protein [Arthrobacter sp. ISL-72]
MNRVNALIIPADMNEPAQIESIDAGLQNLQSIVAGNIEAVSGDDWHFYLNEEGKNLGLEPNRHAALLLLEATGTLTDVYCGNVVFLGETADGSEGNGPGHLIDLAQQSGNDRPDIER